VTLAEIKEINRLVSKFFEASKQGFDLGERDRQRLLKLLFKENTEINALMDKWDRARLNGVDLNEADKATLLRLLLDKQLRGTGNQ